ncbi:flavodoxin family protein [Chloroflexota bacterium]
MTQVLIIYHSQSGNTEKMAKAVSEGAVSAGATVVLKKAADAVADDLLDCGVVVFGTPNYFNYEAGAVKDFFDRTFYTLRGKVTDKPCATFGSYGGGGNKAIQSLNKMCDRLVLKKAAESVGALREPSSENLEECKALGAKMAIL